MSEKNTYWVYEYQGLKTVQGSKYWSTIFKDKKIFNLIAQINTLVPDDIGEYLEFRFVRKKYVVKDEKAWLKKTNTITEIMPDYAKSTV